MNAIALLLLLILAFARSNKIKDEKLAQQFLEFANKQITWREHITGLASFRFQTDITDENEHAMLQLYKKFRNFNKELWNNVPKFDFEHFKNESLRRQFKQLSHPGTTVLSRQEANHYSEVLANMSRIFASAKACVRGKCGLDIEPALTEIMANSRDYDELEEAWTAWRESAGRPIRPLYKQYVDVTKKIARLNGFNSIDELWLETWETKHFKQLMRNLWKEVKPVFQLLHTYVRMKLRQRYGNRMPSDGTIPAHLLGNMWAQQWANIQDMVVPFPNKKTLDVTNTMKKQNYTAIKMFKIAEKFFTDIGLPAMTDQFWNNSMIVKPKNKTVLCHAAAADMSDKKDFRIKMCTDITMVDLFTIHHEMGHIEYYALYRDQPALFRQGANPAFHEAVGDTIALSVATPKHLYKIGLYSELDEDYEMTINYQMSKALEKLAFLPFGYIIDLWRWDVVSGKITYDEWNKRWWQLRLEYQGISPPNKRTETDFDPGAKYHIPATVEYIRYFVSFIIQFQFHKALCSIAQPNVPLHKCDIDNNKAAGERLASALRLGSSKPWPDVMEILTGSRRISTGPLVEYFDPLLKYLKTQIKNETIGWDSDGLSIEPKIP